MCCEAADMARAFCLFAVHHSNVIDCWFLLHTKQVISMAIFFPVALAVLALGVAI